MWPAHGFLIM